MPRPSKKQQRTEEILEAFARCVARYGLDGATLELLAGEVGLQRPLVRHFVGNREALERQLAERVIALSVQGWKEFLAAIDNDQRIEYLLQGLFTEAEMTAELSQLTEALLLASRSRPWLKQMISQWLVEFEQDIQQQLSLAYPQQSAATTQAVSFALFSLYLNLDSIAPLNLTEDYRATAIEAARRLLTTLK